MCSVTVCLFCFLITGVVLFNSVAGRVGLFVAPCRGFPWGDYPVPGGTMPLRGVFEGVEGEEWAFEHSEGWPACEGSALRRQLYGHAEL